MLSRRQGEQAQASRRAGKSRFLWNWAYARIIRKKTKCSRAFAWEAARAADDSFFDGETPEDAVDIELSYWEE